MASEKDLNAWQKTPMATNYAQIYYDFEVLLFIWRKPMLI
jgi:hypothetical protein